jgi:DNA-binding NtrC family response regulator
METKKGTNNFLSDMEGINESNYSNKGISKKKDEKQPHSKKNILIYLVDDDLIFLHALEQCIKSTENERLEIKCFSTAEECIEKLQSHPDIIILDYYLDSKFYDAMNGMKALKKIKRLSPLTKVIILSSQSNMDVALNSMKNQAFDYVSKHSEDAFIKIKKIVEGIMKTLEAEDQNNNLENTNLKISIAMAIIIISILILIALT